MLDVAQAERLQLELRQRVELPEATDISPETVAGLDVSYATDSDRVVAAVVVLDVATLQVIESATAAGVASFPYIPGLLAFRETPVLLEALAKIKTTPHLLVCDGYGIAHPRRFGLACHLGVLTGLPAFGVAKTAFTTAYQEPGLERGDWSELRDGSVPGSACVSRQKCGQVLGRVLRTQAGVKPVFVSVGHRIGLDEATSLTLALCGKYRLPETTRHADHLSRVE